MFGGVKAVVPTGETGETPRGAEGERSHLAEPAPV
jgi:hypothetical protein